MTVHDGLVIFDCDGVLIDSEAIACGAISETLADFGISMSQREALDAFVGKSENDVRLDLRTRGLENYDKYVASWRENLYAAFATDLKIIQGIEVLLEQLDAPICVASNSSHERLERSLGTTSIWSHFSQLVYSADDVERPKPAPDLIQLCLSSCKAPPETSIMIDDNASGVIAALAAGVTPIGFVDPNDPRPNREQVLREAGATIVATGAEDLLRALKSLSVPFKNS
jgi:HAD superfamily hydrolase (TIGR01509 family)